MTLKPDIAIFFIMAIAIAEPFFNGFVQGV